MGFTGPGDPDWGYVLVGTNTVCGRCGLVIGKVGPHMDWHRWLDEKLDGSPTAGVPSIQDVLDIAFQFGQTDGAHHKAWVIDQMVRCLTGDYYDEWVCNYKAGEDGPDTYDWDEGIAP